MRVTKNDSKKSIKKSIYKSDNKIISKDDSISERDINNSFLPDYQNIYRIIFEQLKELIPPSEGCIFSKLEKYFFDSFEKGNSLEKYFTSVLFTYVFKNNLYVDSNKGFFKLDSKLKVLFAQIKLIAIRKNSILLYNNNNLFNTHQISNISKFSIYEESDNKHFSIINILSNVFGIDNIIYNILDFLFSIKYINLNNINSSYVT